MGAPPCCFDCILCAEGEISNDTGEEQKLIEGTFFHLIFSLIRFLSFFLTSDSLHCNPCPPEFWPNVEQTTCVPRQLDFLSFSETLGITLTTVAVSGATVTAAVFVVFLHHRHTPIVSLFDFGFRS